MYTRILETITDVLNCTHSDYADDFSEIIMRYNRIFVTGAGRSGLVAKFFGMRLCHLGKLVYIVGETTTPRIQPQDLIIVISGSGGTPTMLEFAKKSRNEGATIASITSNIDSPLSRLSDYIYLIGGEGPTKGDKVNIMPMGTIFELSSLIFLESVIAAIIFNYNIPEEDLKSRHTILE